MTFTKKLSDQSSIAVLNSQVSRLQEDVSSQGKANEANFAEIKVRMENKYATKEELFQVQKDAANNKKMINWLLVTIGTPAVGALVYAFFKLILK